MLIYMFVYIYTSNQIADRSIALRMKRRKRSFQKVESAPGCPCSTWARAGRWAPVPQLTTGGTGWPRTGPRRSLGPQRQGHRWRREATNQNDWNFPSRFALTTCIELPPLDIISRFQKWYPLGWEENGSVEMFTFQLPVDLGHSGWKTHAPG